MESVTISRDEILQAVKNDVGCENVEILEYTIEPASPNPLGFLGDHKRVKGKVKIQNNEEKEFRYFAKLIPSKVPSHREYAEKTKAFFKEIEMYKTLFDDMKNAMTPSRWSLKWRPDSYFTRDWDVVLVEDLSLQGYYMLPERTLMSLEHVKITIKTLARMNAGTFILEAKLKTGQATTHSKNYKPGSGTLTIRDLYPELIFESECINEPGHPGYSFWEAGLRSQLAVIDLLPGYTVAQKEEVKKRFPDILRNVYAMALPSDKYKNVITHGDLWGNNILFKNGQDGKVSEAILVDFQMTRYAPPAQDLLVLLHIVQNKASRDQYEHQLVDLYYQSLLLELEAEGLNINEFLPRTEFNESLKFYKKFAILTNIIYTQLNQIPPEATAKFLATTELYEKMMFQDRSEMLVELFHTDELTRHLQTEAINELIEIYNIL